MSTATLERPETPAPQEPIVLVPLETPLVIDAIRCRLRQDAVLSHFGNRLVAVPLTELILIMDILDAARQCVKEWSPAPSEKAHGAGTGVGMRAAEDRLIAAMKRDL